MLTPVNAQWRELGVQFGFGGNDLDGIEQSNQCGGVQRWMTDMLEKKLKKTPGFGLDDVRRALRIIGREDLIDCPKGCCTSLHAHVHHYCHPA